MKESLLSQIQTWYRVSPDFKSLEFILKNVPIDISLSNILSEPAIKEKIYREVANMIDCELIKKPDIPLNTMKINFVIEYEVADMKNMSSKTDNLIGAIINKINLSVEQKKFEKGLNEVSEEFGVILPGMIPSSDLKKGITLIIDNTDDNKE